MSLVADHRLMIDLLLNDAVEEAVERHGLAGPDPETERIMRMCVGLGFVFGMAYGQADTALPVLDRIGEAFRKYSQGEVA